MWTWKKLKLGIATAGLVAVTGCSNLPGNAGQQGAVIGGASGAAVGAAVTKNRALGAVIGGAVGAAGGYVVGSNKDKILGKDGQTASDAERRSQESPVTVEQARSGSTADVNSDGFVTLDEVVALKQTGLSDDQLVEKLRATNHQFNLTEEQKQYLADRGVSRNVIDRMTSLNQDILNQPRPSDSVIGRPSPGTL